VVGTGQILVAAAISTSSGFYASVISQSTSFALVLLLFVLEPFPINSGAFPKGIRLHALCDGGGCYEVAEDGSGG
jgi:hypothetical protein